MENKVEKLTADESARRYAFIGKAVDRNWAMPNAARFGVQNDLTVQQICNSNIETLKVLGTGVKKAADAIDPEFSDSKEGLVLNGIPGADVVDFIKLTIRRKKYIEQQKELARELAETDRELTNLQTPAERRKALMKRKSELTETID